MPPQTDLTARLEITETAFEAMRAERDRFAHENTELQGKISHLKNTVRGEQEAKDRALHELETVRQAWKTEARTKEAIAQLAPADTEVVAQYEIELKVARATLAELRQGFGDLVARVDRDGGQAQDADGSLAVTVRRIDKELVRLQTADTDLKLLTKETQTSDGMLRLIRAFLPLLDDGKRETFFYEVERGYCGSCGRKLQSEDSFCQCTNDE